MTTDEIARLIKRRDKLACRRDGRINRPALREIDAKLSAVPAGADNRVDLALGRPCAQLPQRTDADYQSMSEGRPDGIVDHDDALAGAWA